jgi:2-oxoglutarate ferredoxin oxidoreductase subunit beta
VLEVQSYKSKVKPTWCPGCGDFAVLKAFQQAVARLQLDPKDILVVSGIGCSSNFPHFVATYGFHGIHGRILPVAAGAKLANPELTVVGAGGDGDGYGIGLNHFIHTARRNFDITYIVMNNQIYGLTTGQYSPTSQEGMVTKSTPEGAIDSPVNPIALALGSGATYVSRGFSGDTKQLTDLIAGAIEHKGFALVDALSPCVTFNKVNTYPWFRERVYGLEEAGHDPSDIDAAFERSREWLEKIPVGLFYKVEKPTYEEQDPGIRRGIPIHQERLLEDPKALLEEFM